MKNIIMLFFLFTGTASLHGQDYVPLLDTNKVWNLFEDYFTWGNTYPHYLEICDTDTTRFIVKKKYTEQVIAELGYLREDTVAQKVYYTNIYNDNEVLLYDFTLDVGDTFQGTEWLEVLEVDSIQLHDGTLRKRIVLVCGFGYHEWIEGIGNTWGGLIWTDWNPSGSHEAAYLLCYFENDSILYRNELFSYDCDYSYTNVNIETIDNTYIPKIYPNPFSQKVSISLENIVLGETFELAVKTLDGRTVYNETLVSDIAIDLSFLGKGIYLLTIKNKHFQFTEKLIKL